MRLLGVAAGVLLATASTAPAGNIILTGHDILLHDGQNGYDEVVLNFLREAGTPNEIPSGSYDIGVIGSGVGSWGWTNVGGFNDQGTGPNVPPGFESTTFYNTDDLDGNPALQAAALSHDCLVILAHTSCGGCDLSTAGSNVINTQMAAGIAAAFDGGMDLWVNSGASLATYYDFLPPEFAATAPPIAGTEFCATAAGVAIGITVPMTTGFPTHNRFEDFSPVLTIFETNCPGGDEQIISIGATAVSLTSFLTPVLDFNPPDSNHTVALQITGGPASGIEVTFDVIAGPNVGDTGIATTNVDGIAEFTYADDGGIGVDRIRASFEDPTTGETVNSNVVLKFWDLDCNDNGIPDTCDIDCDGFEGDCNSFEACGASLDENEDGIPDECGPDCNGNGIPDDVDIATGTSPDCNGNGIPDECDIDPLDPDGDGLVSPDCNANGIPDECDIDPLDPDGDGLVSPDCNANGIPDECDIADGTSQDCNENGVPDECDIASGESTDFNDNGIPDECELEPAFEEPLSTEAAGGGNFEAVGDFDDNGTPDVAIIIPGETPTVPGVVQVFLNRGVDEAGVWLGLVATDPVPVGLSPSGIAVGRLNADDLPDVAVTNAGENTVSILINLGLDGFDVWQGLEVFDTIPVGSNPSSITAAELTGDGFIDLAVTETETPLGLGSGSVRLHGLSRFVEGVLGTSGGGLVLVLTNDGNAGFSDGGIASTGGVSPRGLSDPEDVDNDKHKDLVGIHTTGLTSLAGGTTGNVFVLLGDGKGGFGPPLTFDVGENPTDVAVGDLDQDGFPDIAVTNGADGTVSVLLNQGTGAESGTGLFAVVDVLTVGSNPLSVDAADLDGDGDLDLAVVAEDPIFGPAVRTLQNLLQSGDPLALFAGETTLAFGPPASFNIEADPQFIVSADLNGDGLLDLATVNLDDDEPTGGSVTGLVTDPEPIALPVHLDIKPGSCPNSFNRTIMGYLPVALLGSESFDVLEINLATIELTRSDGIGGSVAPHEGPPGPHSVFADVATPFGDPAATDCGCHALLGDGTLDLMMKFRRPTLVSVLNLNNVPSGVFVSLKIRGNLLAGTPFEARDCIRLVPP